CLYPLPYVTDFVRRPRKTYPRYSEIFSDSSRDSSPVGSDEEARSRRYFSEGSPRSLSPRTRISKSKSRSRSRSKRRSNSPEVPSQKHDQYSGESRTGLPTQTDGQEAVDSGQPRAVSAHDPVGVTGDQPSSPIDPGN